jgi:hypothetical protein
MIYFYDLCDPLRLRSGKGTGKIRPDGKRQDRLDSSFMMQVWDFHVGLSRIESHEPVAK